MSKASSIASSLRKISAYLVPFDTELEYTDQCGNSDDEDPSSMITKIL